MQRNTSEARNATADYQLGAPIGFLEVPSTKAATSDSSDTASGDDIEARIDATAGPAMVDLVNPRLSRYGIKAACRLALSIVIVQLFFGILVVLYFRAKVREDSKLVDYSTALVIGKDSDTEGLCGTYTVMAAVLESEVKLSRSIALGRAVANTCIDMAIGSEFAISLDKSKHLPYIWQLLEHGSICGDARDVKEYVDTCNRIAMAVIHTPLNISHTDRPIEVEYFAEVDISIEVPLPGRYSSGVIKDDAIYFAPRNANSVGIFNTTTMSFGIFDISKFVHGTWMYSAAVQKDDVIYLVPQNAKALGIFNITAWTFDQKDLPQFVGGIDKYSDGVLKDDAIYLVPDKSNFVGIYNITNKTFRTIPISTGKAMRKYSGGVMKDGAIYFVPWGTPKVGIFNTASLTFSTVDISAAVRGGKLNFMYRAGALKDDAIYFAPQDRDDVGIFNITTRTFRTLSLPKAIYGNMKFSDCAVKGDTVYLVPWKQNSLCKLNVKSETFSLLSISNNTNLRKYRAGVITDDALYFVPEDSPAVGRLLIKAVQSSWDNRSREALRDLRTKVAARGRTAPCVLDTRTCSEYTCFNSTAVACSESTRCLGPTVNVKQVTRMSWFAAMLEAASLAAYYEIGATALLLTGYLSYLRFCAKSRKEVSLKDLSNVVLEGQSQAELDRQRRGE